MQPTCPPTRAVWFLNQSDRAEGRLKEFRIPDRKPFTFLPRAHGKMENGTFASARRNRTVTPKSKFTACGRQRQNLSAKRKDPAEKPDIFTILTNRTVLGSLQQPFKPTLPSRLHLFHLHPRDPSSLDLFDDEFVAVEPHALAFGQDLAGLSHQKSGYGRVPLRKRHVQTELFI